MRSLQYRIALILVASIVAVMLVATAGTSWMLSSSDSLRMIEPTAQRIATTRELLQRQDESGTADQSGATERSLAVPSPPITTPLPTDQTQSASAAAPAFPPDPAFSLGGPPAGLPPAGLPTGGPPPGWPPAGGAPPNGPPVPRFNELVTDTAASGRAREDLASLLRVALAEQGANGAVEVTENSIGQVIASYQLDDGRWAQFGFPLPMPPPPGLWAALAGWLVVFVAGVVAVALVMARRVTEPFTILERAVAAVGPDGGFPHIPEKGTGEARQTAAVLNRLSERLRESIRSRMRLVAAAGHDLRTPMTRMRLRAEFLPEDDRQSWVDDLDELELIADSAIGLVREEGAREDQSNVALDTLVRQTVDELVAAGLSVRLEAAEPAMARAAPLSLRRALRNLFTNAATHGGGAVVRLSAEDGQAHVIIDDSGPGIPPELMGRMFEPFFRVNPARGKQIKGAGLGLAIAKDIVERFGGSIDISNRPEGGLRQIVTLAQLGGKAS